MSFFINMTFIKSDYLGQFKKPMSFGYWELPKKVLSVLLSAIFAIFQGVSYGDIVDITNQVL